MRNFSNSNVLLVKGRLLEVEYNVPNSYKASDSANDNTICERGCILFKYTLHRFTLVKARHLPDFYPRNNRSHDYANLLICTKKISKAWVCVYARTTVPSNVCVFNSPVCR